jgi:hypothetical protein
MYLLITCCLDESAMKNPVFEKSVKSEKSVYA